ncbi:MAG: NAD(P)H-dependent oxidoreductase subunit E [Deltaproteobacteria bacterium]|nr:NAD(P)H-dependent oxidoreductase subunit E [Deltaproteobacteria bacterium]
MPKTNPGAPEAVDLTGLRGLLESRPPEARELLPLLRDIQTRYRHLPEEAVRGLSEYLGLPLARVYAVSRFYKSLSRVPKGERLVKVCLGTACHLRGAPALLEALEGKLGLALGETGKDGRFTLESVNCVGACALAPVVMLDDEVHGKLNDESLADLPL